MLSAITMSFVCNIAEVAPAIPIFSIIFGLYFSIASVKDDEACINPTFDKDITTFLP